MKKQKCDFEEGCHKGRRPYVCQNTLYDIARGENRKGVCQWMRRHGKVCSACDGGTKCRRCKGTGFLPKLTPAETLRKLSRLAAKWKRDGFDDDVQPYKFCSEVQKLVKAALEK